MPQSPSVGKIWEISFFGEIAIRSKSGESFDEKWPLVGHPQLKPLSGQRSSSYFMTSSFCRSSIDIPHHHHAEEEILTHSYCQGSASKPLLGETIGQRLDKTTEMFPDREYVVCVDDQRRATFADFREEVYFQLNNSSQSRVLQGWNAYLSLYVPCSLRTLATIDFHNSLSFAVLRIFSFVTFDSLPIHTSCQHQFF